MSIATVVSYLQNTLHAGVPSIAAHPLTVPDALNTADLPLVLTIPGPAAWNEQAVGLKRCERTYLVRCYVLPVGEGAGVNEGYQTALGLLQAFGEAYLDDITLGGTVDHVDDLTNPIQDSGITTLEYAGVSYHGFEYRLHVVEKGG